MSRFTHPRRRVMTIATAVVVVLAGAGGYFAPLIRAYIRRANAPDHVGIMVGVKDRQNALRNPYAHLHIDAGL